jgi:hypothetical protein
MNKMVSDILEKASSSAGTGGAKSISGKSGGGSRSPSPAKKAPTGGRTGSPSSRPVLIPAAAFAAGSGRFRASMTGDDYSMMDSSMNTTASSAVFGGAGRGQRLSAGSTRNSSFCYCYNL